MRFLLCAGVLAALALAPPGQAVTLRVRGSSRVEARATPRPTGVEVEGRLIDDTGGPIGAAELRVALDHGGRFVTPAPTPCPGMPPPATRGTDTIARTNAGGRFCVVFPQGELARRLRIRYPGDQFHDPSAVLQVPVDGGRRAVELSFAPEPRYFSLERGAHDVWVRAHVTPPDLADEPLQLQLSFEGRGAPPEPVGAAVARAGERVRILVPTERLRTPGPGRLKVRFAGTRALQAAEYDTVVECTARVDLSIAAMPAPGDPLVGIEVPVAVGSSRGAVPSGLVEALAGGRSVGSAPVKAGAARVVVRFDGATGRQVPLTFRYLPDAPWWLPGAPLEAFVHVAPPSPWRRWPWALAALLVVAWVMRSWPRPRRAPRAPQPRTEERPSGKAEVVLVERGPERSGWRGLVVDAHEGTPIEGARVSVIVPSFGGSGVAASTQSSADGRFHLDHVVTPEGSRLVVEAPWHARLVRGAPPAGAVAISLVTRRRALVDGLVSWAQALGRPWAGRKEPTPGHVARVAGVRRSEEVRQWAEAVEQAAFGPDPVDETFENAVRARQPQGPPTEHT